MTRPILHGARPAPRPSPPARARTLLVALVLAATLLPARRSPAQSAPVTPPASPPTSASAGGAAVAAEVIDIWPEGVPGLRADVPAETEVDERVYHVSHPTLTVVRPKAGRANGTAVIVCPGGGYVRLAINKEGTGVAHWLAAHGVTAFILKYRMQDYGHPAPLRDILRSVRLVRDRAAALGVDAGRIGVCGASAGGHLAACAGTLFDSPEGRTGAPLDAVSARPDFLILMYPVMTMGGPDAHQGSRLALLGAHPTAAQEEAASPERHVTGRTPPTFIVHTEEDRTVRVENSILFYEALRRAGVPVEMHLYARGPHGFGMAQGLGTTSLWPDRCLDWLEAGGWLGPAR